MNVTAGQRVCVKNASGVLVECAVVEKIPSLFSIQEQVAVIALKGHPFGGQAKVVVPLTRIFASECPAGHVHSVKS